jgi:hypothetical protein
MQNQSNIVFIQEKSTIKSHQVLVGVPTGAFKHPFNSEPGAIPYIDIKF